MQENENVKTHKVIIVATIMGFITSFEMNNIKLLQQLGYQVSCAANLEEDNHPDKVERLKDSGVKLYHIPFSRSPFTKQNIRAYKELRKLMREEHFDLIHCHTPVGGVLGRMAAHKEHVPRIIYTAHGFHFYDGAPLKNWLIFYPIEKFLSKYTDVLITINKEDYRRATEKFHAKKTAYVPGVGIDIEKFATKQTGLERVRTETNLREIKSIDFSMEREKHGFCENQGTLTERQQKRIEIGVPLDAKLLISVGELSTRKNHKVVVQALQELPGNYWYIIVGKGSLRDELESIDHTGRLKLLGYRTDIAELLQCSDVFVFPSLQEGLPVALMEAMASGLPVVCSRIRGNVDLIDDENCLFDPNDVKSIEKAIRYVLSQNIGKIAMENLETVKKFSLEEVGRRMEEIYRIAFKD